MIFSFLFLSLVFTNSQPVDNSESTGASSTLETRLVGGTRTGVLQGRLDGGEWGFVCDDLFDTATGLVVCRSMDMETEKVYFTWTSTGSDNFLIDDFLCSGSETELSECTFTTEHDCSHYEGLQLTCGRHVTTKIGSNSELILTIEDSEDFWGDHYVCGDNAFTAKEAKAACTSMGYKSWTNFERIAAPMDTQAPFVANLTCPEDATMEDGCDYAISDSCDQMISVICEKNDVTIRLVDENGADTTEQGFGYLQASVNEEEYGYVCDDVFSYDNVGAEVACSEMGFDRENAHQGDATAPSASFSMDDLNCSENETSIADCSYSVKHDCAADEAVMLYCVPDDIQLRLVGRDGSEVSGSEGVLQASVNGQDYGYVCDDFFDWDSSGAQVACKQLGFDGRAAFHFDAEGTPFVLDDIECTGNETSISECSYNLQQNCQANEAIYLVCEPEIELKMGSNNTLMARMNSGDWGYVCYDYFDNEPQSAFVACKSLGRETSKAHFRPDTSIEEESEYFALEALSCTGTESNINECKYDVRNHCPSARAQLDCESSSSCYIGGCSGEICSSEMFVQSDCQELPEYSCLPLSNCGKHGQGGACAWAATKEFVDCMEAMVEPEYVSGSVENPSDVGTGSTSIQGGSSSNPSAIPASNSGSASGGSASMNGGSNQPSTSSEGSAPSEPVGGLLLGSPCHQELANCAPGLRCQRFGPPNNPNSANLCVPSSGLFNFKCTTRMGPVVCMAAPNCNWIVEEGEGECVEYATECEDVRPDMCTRLLGCTLINDEGMRVCESISEVGATIRYKAPRPAHNTGFPMMPSQGTMPHVPVPTAEEGGKPVKCEDIPLFQCASTKRCEVLTEELESECVERTTAGLQMQKIYPSYQQQQREQEPLWLYASVGLLIGGVFGYHIMQCIKPSRSKHEESLMGDHYHIALDNHVPESQ